MRSGWSAGVPPFLLAAMRFLIAGLALYGGRGAERESAERREWASVSVLRF